MPHGDYVIYGSIDIMNGDGNRIDARRKKNVTVGSDVMNGQVTSAGAVSNRQKRHGHVSRPATKKIRRALLGLALGWSSYPGRLAKMSRPLSTFSGQQKRRRFVYDTRSLTFLFRRVKRGG